MSQKILVTGATDGIGYETARMLISNGHQVLLHGRNVQKLEQVAKTLSALHNTRPLEQYIADLSDLANVETLAQSIRQNHTKIDVLINNAGILKTPTPTTQTQVDVRFVVNTIAPYLLTKRLLPLMGTTGRIVNLSSAAQTPVDPAALIGPSQFGDMEAYAQSKLAITMWSFYLARQLGSGPSVIAVNPGSLLGSKMVKEGFGIAGSDISIGADILARLAVGREFDGKTGAYFDNDIKGFGSPHPDALDERKVKTVVDAIESHLAR